MHFFKKYFLMFQEIFGYVMVFYMYNWNQSFERMFFADILKPKWMVFFVLSQIKIFHIINFQLEQK